MYSVQLPKSKSILNRCLILSALTQRAHQYLPPDHQLPNDVVVMKRLLYDNVSNEYNVEDAGSVFRFLTAFLSIQEGTHRIYGTQKLNERPIQPLVKALQTLGCNIESEHKDGNAPLIIRGATIHGGDISLDAGLSSQFLSALMLIAPMLPNGLRIHLEKLTSSPYINITVECLRWFGAQVSQQANVIEINSGFSAQAKELTKDDIESDWSSAAFWYSLSAVTGKSFELRGLKEESVQGDKASIQLFEKLGIETQFTATGIIINKNASAQNAPEFNLVDCPDLGPALIVACALLKINAKFYGLKSLAYKESNRLLSLEIELEKLGVQFINANEAWELKSQDLQLKPIQLNTYLDHRMAMAFASAQAVYPEITIENPDCVSKSYPMFWVEFNRIFRNGK